MAIAIIGSGPAGLYTADALSRALPGRRIDIIERLPFPFGLIRYGVAPDHEATKNVTQVLSRVLSRPGVRFHGDIEVGRDISLAEIKNHFDAVVIATGAQMGRRLDIPGLSPNCCVSAYDMARWFNGHPDLDALDIPTNVQSVCIVGNGNVALDMARVLAKSPDELAKYDVSDRAIAWLTAIDLNEIHIVGRRRIKHVFHLQSCRNSGGFRASSRTYRLPISPRLQILLRMWRRSLFCRSFLPLIAPWRRGPSIFILTRSPSATVVGCLNSLFPTKSPQFPPISLFLQSVKRHRTSVVCFIPVPLVWLNIKRLPLLTRIVRFWWDGRQVQIR